MYKNKIKVLITAIPFLSIDNNIRKLFKKKNIEFEILPAINKFKKKDISKFDAIIAGVENYDVKKLSQAKNLKIISRVGIGTDSIDLNFCKKRNIKILKVKSPYESVAEYTISAIISSLRNFSSMNHNLHQKVWKPVLGKSLSEATVGIIGFGKIGKLVARYLKFLNINKILVHDIKKFGKMHKIKFCKKIDLIKNSDVISLNIDLNKKTKNFISFKEINSIKKPLSIINTSRGKVINEKALIYGIKKKKIKNVFLDVFEKEPYYGQLRKYKNCMMTPHISSFTNRCRREMELESINNLLKNLKST